MFINYHQGGRAILISGKVSAGNLRPHLLEGVWNLQPLYWKGCGIYDPPYRNGLETMTPLPPPNSHFTSSSLAGCNKCNKLTYVGGSEAYFGLFSPVLEGLGGLLGPIQRAWGPILGLLGHISEWSGLYPAGSEPHLEPIGAHFGLIQVAWRPAGAHFRGPF